MSVNQSLQEERALTEAGTRDGKESVTSVSMSSSGSSGRLGSEGNSGESRHVRQRSGRRGERAAKRKREPSTRSHKEADSGSSADASTNPASNALGESIAALPAGMNTMREDMLGGTPCNLSRGQASQPGLNPSGTINVVRAAPTMAPESTPSKMKLRKTARTIRHRVNRNHTRSVYQGCSEGERSELNDPDILRTELKVMSSPFRKQGRTAYPQTHRRRNESG